MRTLLLAIALLFEPSSAASQSYDLILRNGVVIDGTGETRRTADIAITNGRIVAVGNLSRASSKEERDIAGLFVAPGFINIHDHAEPAALSTAANMLLQGVTTEIANADGRGSADPFADFEVYASGGSAVNIGVLIGFNAAWRDVMGDSERRPTPDDIAVMQGIIVRALERGAFGISAGLDFAPASRATTDEVVAIVSSAAPWRVIFQNHERLNHETLFSSLRGMAETLEIGARAGLTPSVTHIKLQGQEQGRAGDAIAMMEAMRRRGIDVVADIYPYVAGQTGLQDLLIPDWAQAGGRPSMLDRFRDPVQRAAIASAAEAAMSARFGGPQGVYVLSQRQELTALMERDKVGAGEAVIRALEASETNAILRFGAEEDVEELLAWPNTSVACDCGATHETNVHPRAYGAFPRVLAHYVRQTGLLTWEDAIRRMTSLPAKTIGLTDRGVIAPGFAADLVIFDPATVQDRNDYSNPSRPPRGIIAVLVNGAFAVDGGQVTRVKAGILLKRAQPERNLQPPHPVQSEGADSRP